MIPYLFGLHSFTRLMYCMKNTGLCRNLRSRAGSVFALYCTHGPMLAKQKKNKWKGASSFSWWWNWGEGICYKLSASCSASFLLYTSCFCQFIIFVVQLIAEINLRNATFPHCSFSWVVHLINSLEADLEWNWAFANCYKLRFLHLLPIEPEPRLELFPRPSFLAGSFSVGILLLIFRQAKKKSVTMCDSLEINPISPIFVLFMWEFPLKM